MSFKIPFKKSAEFPVKKTLCLTSKTGLVLDHLEKKDIDTAQLVRDALDAYLDKYKRDLGIEDISA